MLHGRLFRCGWLAVGLLVLAWLAHWHDDTLRAAYGNSVLEERIAADRTSAEPDDSPKIEEAVERLFAKWSRADLPGCSVAVVRDGACVFQKGFGSANLDHEAANTTETVFEIGSATKSFVCACIALLLDEGKVSPDEDIRKYVAELSRHETPIRIEHLVRCRSGTWDPWHAMQLAGWMSEPIESPHTKADVLHMLVGQTRLPFEPGTKFQYGSGDYFLLGQLVERVTGDTLARFARDRLFEPLGMTRTYIEEDATRIVKQRATGYYRDLDGAWRKWTTNGGGMGGWGLKTCVDDLIRWNANFDDSRLPKGKYIDEFWRSGTLLGNANVVDLNAGKPYRGLRRVQCTGGMPGFAAAMTRFSEKKLTVICLSNNSSDVRPWKIAERIADLYLFDGAEAEADSQNKDERLTSPTPAKLSADELREKVGVWRSAYRYIFRVEFEDGRLHFLHHLGATYAMKPLDKSRFELVGYPVEGTAVRFERASPDAAPTLWLEWPGGKERCESIALVRPSAERMQEYVGEYFSEEMRTTYRFRLREGKLWLSVNSRGWEPLEPTVSDEFIPETRRSYDNRIFEFRRDDEQRIERVEASLWRVSNVVFGKRE